MVKILRAFEVGNVVDCSNVDDAISKLHKFTFDCAIVDWMMKGKNGIQFVRYVRKHSTSIPSNLAIIICTGLTDHEHIVLARDSGVNEIMAKPFSVEEVYRKLNSAIFRSRQWIATKTFVGPDRRRLAAPTTAPLRRLDEATAARKPVLRWQPPA